MGFGAKGSGPYTSIKCLFSSAPNFDNDAVALWFGACLLLCMVFASIVLKLVLKSPKFCSDSFSMGAAEDGQIIRAARTATQQQTRTRLALIASGQQRETVTKATMVCTFYKGRMNGYKAARKRQG